MQRRGQHLTLERRALIAKEYGEWFKVERSKRTETQEELATRLGVSIPTLKSCHEKSLIGKGYDDARNRTLSSGKKHSGPKLSRFHRKLIIEMIKLTNLSYQWGRADMLRICPDLDKLSVHGQRRIWRDAGEDTTPDLDQSDSGIEVRISAFHLGKSDLSVSPKLIWLICFSSISRRFVAHRVQKSTDDDIACLIADLCFHMKPINITSIKIINPQHLPINMKRTQSEDHITAIRHKLQNIWGSSSSKLKVQIPHLVAVERGDKELMTLHIPGDTNKSISVVMNELRKKFNNLKYYNLSEKEKKTLYSKQKHPFQNEITKRLEDQGQKDNWDIIRAILTRSLPKVIEISANDCQLAA
ncbi:hypothetical protein [Chitinibacter sp. S2-10]|uniref:hypothetical protein n=1 Tax=Chitinibacter sp. S2-10 TaxID=3373597 RepID=UPI003977C3EE